MTAVHDCPAVLDASTLSSRDPSPVQRSGPYSLVSRSPRPPLPQTMRCRCRCRSFHSRHVPSDRVVIRWSLEACLQCRPSVSRLTRMPRRCAHPDRVFRSMMLPHSSTHPRAPVARGHGRAGNRVQAQSMNTPRHVQVSIATAVWLFRA